MITLLELYKNTDLFSSVYLVDMAGLERQGDIATNGSISADSRNREEWSKIWVS